MLALHTKTVVLHCYHEEVVTMGIRHSIG